MTLLRGKLKCSIFPERKKEEEEKETEGREKKGKT